MIELDEAGDLDEPVKMTEVETVLVKLVSDLWKVFNLANTELVAQIKASEALVKQYQQIEHSQGIAADLAAFLTSARESSAPREIAGQNYPLVLETYVRTIPRTGSGLAVRKALGLLEHLD